MTSSDILKSVQETTGIPQNIVNEMCISWSRDVYSLYSKKNVRLINLYDLGNLYFKSKSSLKMIDYVLKDFENSFVQYHPDLNIANVRVREIMTSKVDFILSIFSQILQNIYYCSGVVRSGYNKKLEYDYTKLDEYIGRFYKVLISFPCQLKRKEPSEIQKKALRKLFRSKAFIDIPLYLDCSMWPLRLSDKSKNSLFGLSVSAIVLEKDKHISNKRQGGYDSIAKHKPYKTKKHVNI